MEDQNFKFIKPGEIRTRIAPSPTGFFHIGVARTALFNHLFAKKYQGTFILRIEDTDVERSKPEYEKDIVESLKWLGIEWDEGPDIGGQYGPYRQSRREEIYQRYLEKLLSEDRAYYCFCSEEELEAQRQYQMSIGEPPRYSGKCAQLSKEEVKKYKAEGKKPVIRFRIPARKVEFDDLIRGKIEFDASLIGDIVIAKDLSTPLYNFACVVDDFEMRVSHVIRGEEHISNTPKQILIQKALNFPRPKYAHLPLILGPDRSKLSKRHGAISINQYQKSGYLPETLINFMVFLGWNPGTEREIYSLASLVKEFSIERCQKGGAVFNIKRLDFLNGFYIRQKSIDRLTELCLPYLIESGLIEGKNNPEPLKLPLKEKAQFKIRETGKEISLETLKKIISIYQERLKKLSEISELTDFFFKEKLEYDKELLRWREMTDKEIKHSLDKSRKILYKIRGEEFNKENLERILLPEAEKFAKEIKKPAGPPAGEAGDRGYILWPLRVALTGKKASAGPFEIAEILGKEKVLKRIKKARNKL
ncbi:glutamate--tRNA ligase [Patescibacteria group bacterium]|nr:glutamate--tRNA ligase [Patescibacteria group bacterium]